MQKLNFLFWNIYKKDLSNEIFNIVNTYDIDIVVLAELKINQNIILSKLNNRFNLFYPQNPLSVCTKITIFSKFDYKYITPIYEENRFSIRKINLPLTSKEILLMAVHLSDVMNTSEESRSESCSIIIDDLERVENLYNINNSLIVGDFNMNPFEKGIIKANGFHALMSSSQAKNIKKQIQGRDYNYFYNPMWGLFGDLNNTVPGSYYYPGSDYVSYHWHIFDQVLIRPSLIDNFSKCSLHILEDDGTKSLLNLKGLPNKDDFSDHLPIIFSLNL